MIEAGIEWLADLRISSVAAALSLFVLITAVFVALVRDILSAIIVFAGYSLGMAVFYALLLAPDVAMTEAAIGAGVTTILLLLTIAKTSRPVSEEFFDSVSIPGLVAAGGLFVALLALVPEFPEVGAEDAPAWDNPVTGHYIQEAYVDTGVENAVTAVLAGYRAFDTFGEAVVVFAAGIAVLVVLHLEVFTHE